MALLNSIAPMLCRPFIVPGNIRQSKVTIIAPDTMTAPEAYRMFLSSLETMGLTVQPEGKVLKIIESNRARESAIPIYGGDDNAADAGSVRDPPAAPRARQPRRRQGRARSPEEPRRRHHRLPADQHPGHHRPGVEHPAHGGGGAAARRADGRREDLGHQAAHRVGDRDGDDAAEHLRRDQGGRAPARAAPSGRTCAAATGAPAAAAGDRRRSRRDRDLSVSQIIPDDRSNILIVVVDGEGLPAHPGAGQAARPAVAARRRLRHRSRARDPARERQRRRRRRHARRARRGGQPRRLDVGARRAAPDGRRRRRRRRAAQPGSTARPVRRRRAHRLGQADQLAGHPRLGARLHHACATSSRSSTSRAARCSSRRPSSRSRSTSRASSASPGTAARPSARATISRCSSAARSRRRTSTRSSSRPAALSGLAAGLRGPPIPGADKILGLPPGTSIPSFGVFVQALQNNDDVNVVSMPHILTTDNEKATIQVGQNLPFPGSLGGFPGSAARPARAGGAAGAGLRPRHLGAAPGRRAQAGDHAARQRLGLRAPRDRQRDLRRVQPELQRPRSGDRPSARSSRWSPSAISSRSCSAASSRIASSETVDKVPLLGDIPILGYLFKNTQQDDHQAEPAHHPHAVHHQGSGRSAPHLRAQDARAARVHGALLGVPATSSDYEARGRLPPQARPARGDQPHRDRGRAARRPSCAHAEAAMRGARHRGRRSSCRRAAAASAGAAADVAAGADADADRCRRRAAGAADAADAEPTSR